VAQHVGQSGEGLWMGFKKEDDSQNDPAGLPAIFTVWEHSGEFSFEQNMQQLYFISKKDIILSFQHWMSRWVGTIVNLRTP
jgi:hypothetical protein